MSKILDELNEVQSKAENLDVSLIDAKIDRMMPELGFKPEDNDRLVASYRCAHTRFRDSGLDGLYGLATVTCDWIRGCPVRGSCNQPGGRIDKPLAWQSADMCEFQLRSSDSAATVL